MRYQTTSGTVCEYFTVEPKDLRFIMTLLKEHASPQTPTVIEFAYDVLRCLKNNRQVQIATDWREKP